MNLEDFSSRVEYSDYSGFVEIFQVRKTKPARGPTLQIFPILFVFAGFSCGIEHIWLADLDYSICQLLTQPGGPVGRDPLNADLDHASGHGRIIDRPDV